MWQEDVNDAAKAMEDIAAVILNSRKVEFSNELGHPTNIREISANALKNNMRFEITNKDSNDRSIIHRAAFDQQASQMSDVLTALEDLSQERRLEEVEARDKYGYTALILACIRRSEESSKREQQHDVIKMLLTQGGSNPNAQNTETLFTSLHWAAIHGANDIIKTLLASGAKSYIPDKHGYFPIDYAGMFKHDRTVSILIAHHLDSVNYIKSQLSKIQHASQGMRLDVVQLNQNVSKFWTDTLSQSTYGPILQFSPILNTNILYWAAMFNTIPVEMMLSVLNDMEAYPEGPIGIDNWRTPCHAAAQVGNAQKLKELMSDANTRYTRMGNFNSTIASQQKYKKMNICLDFEQKWSALMIQTRYTKLNAFNTNVFQRKLNEYRNFAELINNPLAKHQIKFSFDFLDVGLNSPLHIASQNGSASCIEVLLVDYNLSYDLRNIEGWMAKDIVQHENVREAYRSHYKRIDKMIKAAKPGSQKKQQDINTSSVGQVAPLPPDNDIQKLNTGALPEDLSLLPERARLNKELLQCREFMPFVPPLVLKVNIPQSNINNTEVVNNMIELLLTSKFKIQMIPSLDLSIYYITLKLEQHELELEAKQMKMKIKMCNFEGKRVFEPNQKTIYEPFRSKDVQKIMLSKLNRIVNMQQLKRQNIILSVIPMHDFSGIHEIKVRWWRSSLAEESQQDLLNRKKCRCCSVSWIPQPLPLIRQLYKESMKFQFSELSSIKNYFGEKVGYYYAWMSFYTIWLLIPAIGGLALTIYQIVIGDVDTIFTSLYAILVCIWVTIFIERWKRKAAEICHKWGDSKEMIDTTSETRVMRDDFIGYEYFSHITHSTEKKTFKAYRTILVFLFSVPIFIILIGACIGVFFGYVVLKSFHYGDETIDKFSSVIAGVVNGIVISIIDLIYASLASIFVGYENHKYQDSYEKSYVFKIFVFKFINTNLSILYTAFNYQSFSKLYYLILGMIISKTVQIFLLKNCKKLISAWIRKKLYFRKITQKARNQQIQHQSYISEIESRQEERRGRATIVNQQLSIEAKRQAAMRQQAVFRDLDQVKYPMYQRLVFNGSKSVETQQLLVDYIEINQMMPEKSELQDIYEVSDVFILFGLATLYSCACPIAPLIVIVHNIADINLDLLVNQTTTRRPITQLATENGPWLIIAQFLAVAAVISNCMLLYFSTPVLQQWLEQQLPDSYQDVQMLWILVGAEHAIIIIKQFCAAVILDVPSWVEKSYLRVQREEQNLAIESQEQDKAQMVKFVRERMEEQNGKRQTQMKEMGEIMGKLEKQIIDKNKTIARLESSQKSKVVETPTLTYKAQASLLQEQKQKETSLVDFLGISPSEWFGKGRSVELDKALTRNLQRRLMHQTFTIIEKEILARRIGKLFDTKSSITASTLILSGGLQILCAECGNNIATIECLQCVDHFCKQCADQLHSNEAICKDHELIMLNEQQPRWKKFEYFSLPVLADNSHNHLLQLHFLDLQQRYLDMNYIEGADKLNLQGLFVDRQYDLLTDFQGRALQTRDKRLFGEAVHSRQARASFNDEELFYMNKVAYYLFVNKATSLTFAQFVKSLAVLQSGPFLQRCTFWLKLLIDELKTAPGKTVVVSSQEATEDTISRSYFEEVIRLSFIQRRAGGKSVKEVLDLLFKESEEIGIGQVIELITNNEDVRDFMACIVQFRPAPK